MTSASTDHPAASTDHPADAPATAAAPATATPPARRRPAVRAVVRSALVPVGTCAASLVLLSAYTASGAAGESAPEISVTNARILQPTNPEGTAALFEIRNTGGTDGTLVSVDSPDLGITMIVRTVVKNGAGRMEAVRSVTVPAGGVVKMTPYTLDVMVLDPPELKLGQKVQFNLWFQDNSRVSAQAVTVRPGS